MTDTEQTNPTPLAASPTRSVDSTILQAARLPFLIALISVSSIVIVFFVQLAYGKNFFGVVVSDSDSALTRFVLPNVIYLVLFGVALFSGYIGYRLTVAAGATSTPVIPTQDYKLLSPLVQDGKADAIDQYVRLSSLGRFTGTFTQLGLTGLPLATIFLTLFFSTLTLFQSESFLDLTKLTLGAFIGSFVQRQVERRADATLPSGKKRLDESVTPRDSA